jgi:secreted trypsin-like serine protease
MRILSKSVAAFLLLTALPLASEAFAGGENWAREFVRKREADAFERMTGINPGSLPERRAGKIIGGKPAPAGKWPFQVGLLLASEKDNFFAQFCGGSIIDEEFILTAAHCTDFLTPHKLHILTGTQSLVRGGERHAVRDIIVHPLWDERTFDFDVAIVQLERKIPNLGRNDKARVLSLEDEDRLASPGTFAFVTGWGDTGSAFPTQLREVAVPIVGRGVCNRPTSYDGAVTARMLCAGFTRGGKDTCQGDSGGPMLVKNADGRFVVQAGITSWGEGCALPNFYGVYTRVARVENWISRTVRRLGRTPVAGAAGN